MQRTIGSHKDELRVVSTNVRSIGAPGKVLKLARFVNAHSPNVIILTETKHNDTNLFTGQVEFAEYQYFCTTPKRIGGVQILVRKDLKPKFQCAFQHHTLVVSVRCNRITTYIIGVYNHSKRRNWEVATKLARDLSRAATEARVIIAGDFNDGIEEARR